MSKEQTALEDNFPKDRNEQINFFLVNVLRLLDAEQAFILAKNLIERVPQDEYFTRAKVRECCQATLEDLKSKIREAMKPEIVKGERIHREPDFLFACDEILKLIDSNQMTSL